MTKVGLVKFNNKLYQCNADIGQWNRYLIQQKEKLPFLPVTFNGRHPVNMAKF